VAGLACLVLGGCVDPTVKDCQIKVDQLTRELRTVNDARAQDQAEIAALKRRVENDPRLAGVRVDDLFTADRIELATRSGGLDVDGKPGDDGVVLYVQPRDSDGDVIKAAGEFTIQLTDLTVPDKPRSLGVFHYKDRDELRKCWYGGLMTNHYTFKCPFAAEFSGNIPREVHARVVFLDWLTGKELTADRTLTLKLVSGESAPPTPS
jgi:hypothetical protein